jgi:CHAT domain-containing protein/tetratricopeptide (TPR) repeat protein
MARRDQKVQSRHGTIRAPARVVGLKARALLACTLASTAGALGLEAADPATLLERAVLEGGQAQEARSLEEHYYTLEDAVLGAAPEAVDARLSALIHWVETLERATFAEPSPSADALCALSCAGRFLSRRPEQRDGLERWSGLCLRAVERIPAGDLRSYHGTALDLDLAQGAMERGEFAAARTHFEHGLEHDPHPRLEPHLLQSLAELERRSGSPMAALGLLSRADACLARSDAGIPDPSALRAQGELLRAQVVLDLGLPDLAWTALERCRVAARASGRPELEGHARVLELNLLLATSRAPEVVLLLAGGAGPLDRQAVAGLEPALRARLGLALADPACVEAGMAEEALDLLGSVLEDPLLSTDDGRIVHVGLVDLHLRRGNLEAASKHLRLAREALARLSTASGGDVHAREHAELEAYASHLMRRSPHDEGAARAQLELLESRFDAYVAQLARNERPRGGVGFLHFAGRRFILNELIELSIAVEGPEAGLASALDALRSVQELGSLSRALSQQGCSAEEARRVLERPDGGVLVFIPDTHRTLVLAFDGRTPGICERAAGKGLWQAPVAAWIRTLSTPPSTLEDADRARNLAAVERQGKRVAELLLPSKVRQRMAEWHSVSVIGMELMNDLPIEALPAPGGGTLGTRMAIDRAPSLPVAVKLARRREAKGAETRGGRGLWLVAAPTIPESAEERLRDLPRIPLGPAEADLLHRPYGQPTTHTFLGERATAAALALEGVEAADVLQITAHGIEIAGRERPAALVLRAASATDDGLLDCDEVEALRSPETVVLSACGAARGESRYGEDGLTHLGGAFLKSGASCVLLSSHQVEARAMQALLEHFHARLCAGDSRAEALRAARAALAAGGRFAHPYYHSLVFAVGLGGLGRQ